MQDLAHLLCWGVLQDVDDDIGGSLYFSFTQGWWSFEARFCELGDLCQGGGSFAFKFSEGIEQGLAVTFVCDRTGDIGDLGGKLFLFVIEQCQAFCAAGFVMVCAVAFYFDGSCKGVWQEDVFFEGIDHAFFEGVTWDA